MHILFVTHCFPRHARDHAGRFLLALAEAQRARGHDVTVVAPHAPGAALEEDFCGVGVRRFRYGPDHVETLAYEGTMRDQVLSSWPARFRLAALLLQQRALITRSVRELRPDVVHVHWAFPGGIAERFRFGRRTPVVVTSHGTDLFLTDRSRAARVIGARVLRAADHVTVVSSPLVARAIALGVRQDHVSVIPMPVDAATFAAAVPCSIDVPAFRALNQPASSEPASSQMHSSDGDRTVRQGRLLFVGRLVERKGCIHALRALSHLLAQGLDAHLTVIGDGPERVALTNAATELGVGDAVTWLGIQPPDIVASHMRRAHTLLVPSVTDSKGEQEGFGMVLVEAMRTRTPVVAYANGGIVDILRHGVTGSLVTEGDAAGLARAIQEIMLNPAEARARADAAFVDAVHRFTPDSIAAEFEGIYHRVIRSQGSRRILSHGPVLAGAAK